MGKKIVLGDRNMKLKPLKAALVGAGNRGCAYADYALSTPQELSIVAVIEPMVLSLSAVF